MLSQAKFWILLWIFRSLWIWSKSWVLDLFLLLRCHEIMVRFKTWSSFIYSLSSAIIFIYKVHSTTTNTSYHHLILIQIIHVTRWTLVSNQIILLRFLVLTCLVSFITWWILLWTWSIVDWWRLVKILLLLVAIWTGRCSSFDVSLWSRWSYYLFIWQEMRCVIVCLTAFLLWLLRFNTELIGYFIRLRNPSILATAYLLLLLYFILLSCFNLFLFLLILMLIFHSSISWPLWILPCTLKDPWWALTADSNTWLIRFLVFLNVFLLLFIQLILSEEILLLLLR